MCCYSNGKAIYQHFHRVLFQSQIMPVLLCIDVRISSLWRSIPNIQPQVHRMHYTLPIFLESCLPLAPKPLFSSCMEEIVEKGIFRDSKRKKSALWWSLNNTWLRTALHWIHWNFGGLTIELSHTSKRGVNVIHYKRNNRCIFLTLVRIWM